MKRTSLSGLLMTGALLSSVLSASVLLAPGVMAQGATSSDAAGKDWSTPAGSMNSQRFSTLNQITDQNVGKLQVAWTFSTGVLRGHEGAPLVIGNVMYVHAPFPNTVFALDLDHDGKILWKIPTSSLSCAATRSIAA
jgi:glucose dehydrogenase